MLSPYHHEYPFQIKLPAWLPPTILACPYKQNTFKVRYALRAYFTPFMNKKYDNYSFSKLRDIIIQKPYVFNEIVNKQLEFEHKIGGFLSIGGSTAKAKITFDRDTYYLG